MGEKVFHKSPFSITSPTNGKGWSIRENFLKGEWLIFLFVLLLFPSNLAKHWEVSSAYIRGVLVDYLLPKIYLIELLIFLLLLLAIARMIRARQFRLKIRSSLRSNPFSRVRLKIILPLVFLFPFLLSFGENLSLSFLRFSELLLWGGFSLWVREKINWERDHHLLMRILSLSVGWVSLLALFQFLRQETVFGYYFLGEPIIYPSLGGVAKTSFLGKEILRAYGTFPHPNLLGGAMALLLPWLLSQGLFLPAGLALIGLFVSFSRLAWICFFLGVFGLIISRIKGFWRSLAVVFFSLMLLMLSVKLLPLSTDLSVTRRVELLQSARAMVSASPLFGVGLGHFTAELPSFGLPSGPTLFLQPVHNIFALITAESGLFALVAILAVLALALREGWRKRRALLLISLLQLILLGLFDHYLYTLPQGLFLTSLVLGLVFSRSVEEEP